MRVLSRLRSSSASRPVLHRCPFLWQHQPLSEPHVRAQLVCLSSVHHTPGPPFPTRCLLCQWKHQGRGRARVSLEDLRCETSRSVCFSHPHRFRLLYLFLQTLVAITMVTLQWSSGAISNYRTIAKKKCRKKSLKQKFSSYYYLD